MKASEAYPMVVSALEKSASTWLDYSPKSIPIAVYDDDSVHYLNHPAPPEERPNNLLAATAVEINGVNTATIPAAMCADVQSLIPLVYHEAFHVYQKQHFVSEDQYHFFQALAFYPELDPNYRALCRAEADVHNRADITNKAAYLAAMGQLRHNILRDKGETLLFENALERQEGTAAYVEGIARKSLYGIVTEQVKANFGWARQYTIGAATCSVLANTGIENWQQRIEQGESPTQILIAHFVDEAPDLSTLELDAKTQEETQAVEQINQAMLAHEQSKAHQITLHFANGLANVMRAFNPTTIISLGDGRLFHQDQVTIHFAHGHMKLAGVIEDYVNHTIRFAAAPALQLINSTLTASDDGISIELAPVQQVSQDVYKLLRIGDET